MAQIRWNIRAFEQLRREPGVKNRLQEEVDRVLAATGSDGYAGGVEEGATRSRGYVVTTSVEAMVDEADRHTMLRALGGP